MSLSNIIGGMLAQGMSRQSHDRLRTGAGNADRGGGIEQMLGAFLGGGRGGVAGRTTGAGGAGGFADMARDFLNKPQAGGMSGAKIGGLGALAGGLLGGGLGGAARGGVMAILGTLALQALRGDHSAPGGATGAAGTVPGAGMASGTASRTPTGSSMGSATGSTAGAAPPPTQEQVAAMTDERAERLVLRAMIGAAQVDGHISDAEMEKIMGGMNEGDVTEEERRMVRDEVSRPVDVEAIGREVSRPEVAAEVYLGALMAVDIDTESERDYFRRLARALKLDQGAVNRLHTMTGAPAV
jgi:uncharacterized membrane protein YebE (DUF533 family)